MTHDGTIQPHLMELQAITDRFEAQWRKGPRPRVTEFVRMAPAPARHALMLELIGIDLDYRLGAGENPSIDEYRVAFPELRPAEVEMLTTRSMTRTAATLDLEEGIVRVARDALSSQLPSDRFKKLEEIGRGGMGSVWRAIQLSTGREVALKELPANALGSTTACSRFEEEIHWASQLQHPHIARVYDSGLLEGSYFYAMELVPGKHLDEYASKNRWTLRQMLEMMSVIAKAVQYAHERGILHRDLKPSNILVTPEGKPVIVDFGLARLVRDVRNESSPRYGDVSGTPAYMAPEQALGRDDLISRSTDVYSLGVIIYYFVTGVFPRSPKLVLDTLRQQVSEERIRPSREINHRIGKDLDALTMKCLAPNPADRYADAHQLGADIDGLLQGLELQARPLNWIGIIRSWCCRPTRLLQAGNLSIATGACFAPFHILFICLAIARFLGASIPSLDHLRLREFIPLMASFLLFDAWLILAGFMVRRNRIWALWSIMATVMALLSWFIMVLLGFVKFDTGGAVSSMEVRLPVYIVFMAFAVVGSIALGLAIASHYAQAFLDQPLMANRAPSQSD
jgi:predicted Ser/Thr protein kinase